MNRMGLIALAAALTLQPLAWAANFTDVSGNFWAEDFIDYLSDRNVITGYPDNSFRPNRPVTRAEFAVMLAKGLNIPMSNAAVEFSDVPRSHWAAGAIQAVADRGWIAGYPGGRFLPNQPISMSEMYAILAKASNQPMVTSGDIDDILSEFNDANTVPTWARPAVATVAKAGIHVDELGGKRLFPNVSATRASVATSIAKLMNPQFRDPVQIAGGAQGEMVDITGTLQATATPGEWVIVTADNKRYYVMEPGDVTKESWFRVGNQVRLKGRVDMDASTSQRTVVEPETIAASQTQQNRITVTGTLKPSTQMAGGWIVETADNKTYTILNADTFKNQPIFRYGATVTVTGNTRPDVNLPASGGTALVASDVTAAQTGNQVAVSGELQRTVEAGGWVVNVTGSDRKFVLLGTDAAEDETWFKPGAQVMVSGNVRTDIPTIYQEGPVLVVSSIQPTPGSMTGVQQIGLYFPNYANVLSSPTAVGNNPVVRYIEGPNVPQKVVQELLEGPSDFERVRLYFQDEDISKLSVRSVTVAPNGTATVVLNAPANFRFANNITPQRLNEQISRTLEQIQGIEDVVVSVQTPTNQVIWSSTTSQ